ncbi:MAG: DNA internalization-related competence protein ComEC/Rec2 [Lachnospiraceae bacterium]|nr:DNA internalization-related competence protein ComEC/Rec2 [Lachnospiraceae bacterium]
MKRQVRLTDNLGRLFSRPITVFFACYCIALILYDDVANVAAKGSAVSATLAIIVLVRIYKGRAGPMALRAVIILFTVPVFMFCAVIRYESANKPTSLKEAVNNLVLSTECSFRGFITDISLKPEKTILYINNAYIEGGTFYGRPVCGSVKIAVKGTYEDININPSKCLEAWDYVSGSGKLRKPAPAANPGGFDEDAYYTVRGIDALINASYIENGVPEEKEMPEEPDLLLDFKKIFVNLRIKSLYAIDKSLSGEEAGVLAAILTGERGLLDEDTGNVLADGGISHVLAVSGLHISLIAGGIYSVLIRISGRKTLSCFISVVSLFLYGIFTGMPVSAVRAVIMSACMLIGRARGRTYDMLSALSVAGLVILAVNPLYIRDSSFIMSFSAALGAVFGREVSCGARIRRKRLDGVFMIGGIYVFMFPVLINTYYYITPYSILINLIIIPLMSLLVPFGGICVLLTSIFGGVIAEFSGGICHYIIKGMIDICGLCRSLPYSKIIIGRTAAQIIVIYYAVILLTVILVMTFRKKKPLWLLVLCISVIVRVPSRGTVVHMLDVGQGECIVVEDGTEITMIDAGSTNVTNLYEFRIGPFLKYMGIDKIDRLILTHWDSDHKNALKDLFGDRDVEVGMFVCADCEDSVIELECMTEFTGVVQIVSAGDEMTLESGSCLHVVSPIREADYADRNDRSVVIEYIGRDMTALFTGDSSSSVERTYISGLRSKQFDILKVAHHGSKNSTCAELLQSTEPSVGIISASLTNRYGHPSPMTLERLEKAGCKPFVTPLNGYIRVTCMDGMIKVDTLKFDTDI